MPLKKSHICLTHKFAVNIKMKREQTASCRTWFTVALGRDDFHWPPLPLWGAGGGRRSPPCLAALLVPTSS